MEDALSWPMNHKIVQLLCHFHRVLYPQSTQLLLLLRTAHKIAALCIHLQPIIYSHSSSLSSSMDRYLYIYDSVHSDHLLTYMPPIRTKIVTSVALLRYPPCNGSHPAAEVAMLGCRSDPVVVLLRQLPCNSSFPAILAALRL